MYFFLVLNLFKTNHKICIDKSNKFFLIINLIKCALKIRNLNLLHSVDYKLIIFNYNKLFRVCF